MRAFKTILVAGAAMLTLMSGAQAQQTEYSEVPPFERMVVGQVRIMRTDRPIRNVLVGTADVADINLITDQRLAITAKKEGITSILMLAEDKDEPALHLAIQVVPHAQFQRKAVEVRSFGKGHRRMSYWCDPVMGCDADEKNYDKASSESVTETILPGGGVSKTTTTTYGP